MRSKCGIFLVEDRDEDALLIRRSIAHAPRLNLVHHAKNAKEAISYLQGAGVYANRDRYPMPQVLVLDLEMPNEDGFVVLEWLKQSKVGHDIKSVALTGRERPAMMTRAEGLGARHCIAKPKREAPLAGFAQQLEDWCHPPKP
ncbi:MAG: response regulator [Verrucomicrobiota bacterium]